MAGAKVFDGRTAIVTGAGSGIGRATAHLLARQGARVVVNDIAVTTSGDSRAAAVVREICDAGGAAVANTDSVADHEAARSLVATALEMDGRLDILVNNAGVAWSGEIFSLEPDRFEAVTASHIKGTYNCSRHAALPMREQGFGRIINLVSRAGLTGLPGTLAYAVGKGGVFGFTNAASRDLSAFGITVNAVNPASTETPMVISALAALEDLGEAGRTRAARLRKAMQSPEQVAVVIAALATPAAAGVNGRFLLVEGNRVGLFQPLAISQSAEAAQPWEVGDLARTLAGFDLETDPDPYA